MEYNDKKIGRNIKAIRNSNKKSYIDFANEIGISDSLLEKIENGKRHATDEIIQIISRKTGFTFNDIKYKDLTPLEKGELYFNEDISLNDFIIESEFVTHLSEIFKLYFPIITTDFTLSNKEFFDGFSIANEKIRSFNCSSHDCINAINHFIRASKTESCADYSAINILSCFGYLYVVMLYTDTFTLKKGCKTTLNKKVSSLFDFFSTIQNEINPNEILKRKRLYLEKYNKFLTEYMRKLVESEKNADFAYFYLCIRYWLGIMDDGITLIDENQTKVFGESMFDSLWKMGNKYATSLHDYMEAN